MKTKTSLAYLIALLASNALMGQVFRPNVVSGAVTGSVIGAVIGNNSGGHNGGKGALVGGVVGAIIGASLEQPPVYTQVPVVYAPAREPVVYQYEQRVYAPVQVVQQAPIYQAEVQYQPQPVVYQQVAQPVVYRAITTNPWQPTVWVAVPVSTPYYQSPYQSQYQSQYTNQYQSAYQINYQGRSGYRTYAPVRHEVHQRPARPESPRSNPNQGAKPHGRR